MSNVLTFPKNKSKKMIALQKAEGQKFALVFSLFSLVLVAVFSNEQMTQAQREIYLISDNSTNQIEKLNRAIASAQPVTMYRDLEWEKQLAKKLNHELSRMPASSSSRIQLIDKLRFAELKGKYRLVQNNEKAKGLIQEIEYVESQEAGDHPILLKNQKAFLEEYKDAFAIDFSKIELDQKLDATQENYKLFGSNKQAVGTAIVKLDSDGRLLSVRISSVEK